MTAAADPGAVGRVRAALRDAGFTVDGVLDAVGETAFAALGREEPVPARRVLADAGRGRDARDVLVRLLLLDDGVPVSQAETVLPLVDLVSLGILRVRGDDLHAALDVRPYGEPDTDWWVVSDRPRPGAGGVRSDHVLGVGGASTTLARITPRSAVGRALDVGTGCGVQALHLSRHAAQVTVTDVNPRALALADLTAGLSGVSWESRGGSLLEPVGDDRFDLIVSNPPFVVSPGHRITYRDAGLHADDLGRTLCREVPERLGDGGWGVLLANWLHVAGEDWRDRVVAWVAGAGCDAWVVQREVADPAEYVGTWLRDAGEHRGGRAEARYDEWLGALERLGAEGIGMGWIVLNASGRSDPWRVVEDLAGVPRLPGGDEVAAWFAGQGAVAALDAVALLSSRPRWARDLRIVRSTVGRVPLPTAVGRADGWRPDVVLDAALTEVIDRCDGAARLGDVVDRVAAEGSLDRLALLAATLATLRTLVGEGALEV